MCSSRRRPAPSTSPGRRNVTAFTGALIAIMRNGIAGGPEFALGTIYGQLIYALARRGLPRPQQSGTGTAAGSRWPGIPHSAASSRMHARTWATRRRRRPGGRARLTALVAAAALGTSLLLAAVTQRQAGHAPQADPQAGLGHQLRPGTAERASLVHRGRHPGGRPGPRDQITGNRPHHQQPYPADAARHLVGRVGLVQVFASGAITGIARSEGAARLVLESLQQLSRIFAAAGGQSSGREPVATSRSRYTSSAEIERA